VYCKQEDVCDSTEYDEDKLYEQLHSLYTAYREINSLLKIMRNQIPLYVVEPLITAISVINNQTLPPIYNFIDSEAKRKQRRVQKIIVRGTEGALVFTGKK
jgi:hypothetical protein